MAKKWYSPNPLGFHPEDENNVLRFEQSRQIITVSASDSRSSNPLANLRRVFGGSCEDSQSGAYRRCARNLQPFYNP